MTRWGLARKAGVGITQIQGIESGSRDPQLTTLVKLADALDMSSLDDLLGPSRLRTLSSGDETTS